MCYFEQCLLLVSMTCTRIDHVMFVIEVESHGHRRVMINDRNNMNTLLLALALVAGLIPARADYEAS